MKMNRLLALVVLCSALYAGCNQATFTCYGDACKHMAEAMKNLASSPSPGK